MSDTTLPEIPPMSADRLTSQLYHLPAIIGRLGLSVANAQRALNADYTENIKELAAVIGSIVPAATPENRGAIEALLKQLAPSRYQFTETTLDFSADLSESLDASGSIGLGAGFGAVVINAGVSIGFGRDYRAAARIKTILSAFPADTTLTDKLLGRADVLAQGGLPLPPRTAVSAATQNNLRDIVQMAGGKPLPKLAPELPLSPRQQAERAGVEASQYQKSAATFAGIAASEAKGAAEAATKDPKDKDLAVAHARAAKLAANEAANSAKAAKVASADATAASKRVDTSDKTDAEAATKAATDATAAAKAAEEAATAAAVDAAKAVKSATDAGGTP